MSFIEEQKEISSEEEEYECEQCSVEVKTTKDLTITYGCMDMKFCEDCYKTSKDEVEEEEEDEEEVDIIDTTDDYYLCHGFKSNGESSDWYIMASNGTNDIIGEYETEEAARDEWKKYNE